MGIYSLYNTSDTYETLQTSPSGFYISVFSILNPVDPLASVSTLYLVSIQFIGCYRPVLIITCFKEILALTEGFIHD